MALALGASLVAAWLVASALLGLSIVVPSTDSMNPAAPRGAAVIVQQTPASSVAVGDVVTVARPALPPVTQRVVAVADGSLTLRADAATGSGHAYETDSARRVVAAVPVVGSVLLALLRPVVLAPLVAVLVVLAMGALWPTGSRRHAQAGPRHTHA